ncbi:helix-turn-helix transcriptional regulator [Amycolatopsis aidingensis]|uniref:helix-turn-helix transcriptional regulator n=1 Tax=Amycolatopsis aidingensis TaxID=2842453 RepID=UPI001C0DCAAB|nr:helix-turn-helix domain-containing protein [Amycolatopsis aidingensis]
MAERRPLASRRQVAVFLGIPEKTLDQWAYRGLGPRYRRVGKHARYAWRDVEAWLAQQGGGGSDAA